MKILILVATTLLLFVAYYFSGLLKKVSLSSTEDFNEDEDEPLTEDEINSTRKMAVYGFYILAIIIWSLIAISIARLSIVLSDQITQTYLKWIFYFATFTVFLRFPFGILTRTIAKTYEVNMAKEKIVLTFVIIAVFILTINFNNSLPSFLHWHSGF